MTNNSNDLMEFKPSRAIIGLLPLSLLPLLAGVFNYWYVGWLITQDSGLATLHSQSIYTKYFYFLIVVSSLYLMPLLSSFMMQLAISQHRKKHGMHPDSYSQDEEIYRYLPVGVFFLFLLCFAIPSQMTSMLKFEHGIDKLTKMIYGRELPLAFVYLSFVIGKFAGISYSRNRFKRFPYETEPIKYPPSRSDLYKASKQPKQTHEKLIALWMGISLVACLFFVCMDEWPFWIWFASLLASIYFLIKAIKKVLDFDALMVKTMFHGK